MPEDRNRKLRVLHVVGLMNRGGAEVMIMDAFRKIPPDVNFEFLVNYKIKEGVKEGVFDSEILSRGGEIYHIGAQWDIGPIRYIRDFRRLFREVGKPDIIHIHMNAKSGLISLAARIVGIKRIIVHSHGELSTSFRSLREAIASVELIFQRSLINACATDFLGCSHKAIRGLFGKHISKRKDAKVFKNAIDVEKFIFSRRNKNIQLKNQFQAGSKRVVIGTMGRIVRRKNLKFLIEVIYILKQNNFSFIFVNVGTIDDEEYMNEVLALVAKYKLEDSFIHFGLTEDVPSVFSTFDVFVSAAKNEAFGMVAIEAQAMGIPCFLSNGFPNAVDMQIGNVKFLECNDPINWSESIMSCDMNKHVTDIEIQQAFNTSGYDIADNIKLIESLYRENSQAKSPLS